MKNNLHLNFSVDKENKTIRVDREFAAPLDRVWAAWTQPEILDQWWAPKPWQAKTKSMDFRVGGSWLYVMVGPEGETHWSKADYQAIDPMNSFAGLDGFCDENGTINTDMPRSLWKCQFTAQEESTMVTIDIRYEKTTDLETTIEMGFKEGFTAGMENLDAYLASQA